MWAAEAPVLPHVQERETVPLQNFLGLSSQWTRVLSSAKEFYQDEKGGNTCECLTMGESCPNPVCQCLGVEHLRQRGRQEVGSASTDCADT